MLLKVITLDLMRVALFLVKAKGKASIINFIVITVIRTATPRTVVGSFILIFGLIRIKGGMPRLQLKLKVQHLTFKPL